MVTNWSPADEIDTCNGNLIVATNKVIAANKILTEHYMISLIDLSELNSKQIRYKNCWYLILFMAESGEKKRKGNLDCGVTVRVAFFPDFARPTFSCPFTHPEDEITCSKTNSLDISSFLHLWKYWLCYLFNPWTSQQLASYNQMIMK